MQSCLLAGIKKSGTTPENFQLFLKIVAICLSLDTLEMYLEA
jgi:hypothetical protein